MSVRETERGRESIKLLGPLSLTPKTQKQQQKVCLTMCKEAEQASGERSARGGVRKSQQRKTYLTFTYEKCQKEAHTHAHTVGD